MGITYKKIKKYKVDMICDSCGDGRMRPLMSIKHGDSFTYLHECDKCMTQAEYDVCYPYMTSEKPE